MARPPRNGLTLVQQAVALHQRFPTAQRPRVQADRLTWFWQVKPSPCSVTYTIRMVVQGVHGPKVHVVDPPLQRAEGEEQLPHVFEEDRLCLYYDDEFDRRRDLLAETVVPWVSEWLFFYEQWLTTGEWHGGGIHPGEEPDVSSRRARRA